MTEVGVALPATQGGPLRCRSSTVMLAVEIWPVPVQRQGRRTGVSVHTLAVSGVPTARCCLIWRVFPPVNWRAIGGGPSGTGESWWKSVFGLWWCRRAWGPSTTQTDSLRSSACSAQDDNADSYSLTVWVCGGTGFLVLGWARVWVFARGLAWLGPRAGRPRHTGCSPSMEFRRRRPGL